MKTQIKSTLLIFNRIVISSLILLFVGCQMFYSKEDYLIDFKEFVETVKNESSQYSEEDWDNAEVEYNLFSEGKYLEFEDKLTNEDKFEIGKLNGIYIAVKFKKDAMDVGYQVKEVLEQAAGIIEGANEIIKE